MKNLNHLIEIQPNRSPFLFVDKIVSLEPMKNVTTLKYLRDDEWFFKCHWKGDPNMPGMLQLEAMSQTASLILFAKDNPPVKLYLASVSNAMFKRKVLPGDCIEVFAELTEQIRNIYRFKCKVVFEDTRKTISKSQIQLVWPNQKE